MAIRFRFGSSSRIVAALCAVSALTVFQSPTAQAQSLQDALTVAYNTNPTIRAARAQYKATRQATDQARAAGLPQITGSVSWQQNNTRNKSVLSQIDPTDDSVCDGRLTTRCVTFQPRNYGVSGEQAVFTGFRNLNAIQQAKARVRAGGAQLVATEQQILQQAANAYFDVLRATAVYDANKSNVAVLLRQLDEAELRFEVGEITKTDVAQANARLAGSRAQLSASQSQLAQTRAAYRQIIGEAPGDLSQDPVLPLTPENEEQAQSLAAQYAPAVVAAIETEKASRKQINIARGALAPSVSLTAGYQYSEEPSFFTQSNEEFTYGVRASVPIFQGGLNYSRIREAKALNAADRQLIREAERQASATVTTTWEQLLAAQATIASAEAEVSANTLALEGVRRENQVGTRTTLDVLNAEQELLNAKVNLANAERDKRAATFALLAASGVLTPEAVGVALGGSQDD